MKRKLNVILHPLVLSLPFAAILIVLLPNSFDKYKIRIDEKFNTPAPTTRINYYDLDHDGYSESIIRHDNPDGTGNFVVYTHAGGVINQWNFMHAWVPRSELVVGDCNNNGFDEIYGFTVSDDSVFLEGIEVTDNPDTIVYHYYIDRIADLGDQSDFSITGGQVINVDDDDQKELLFAIHAGFPQQPRNIYLFDPLKNELLKSPPSGSGVRGISVVDIDNDGFMEIINNANNASNNIHIDVPYNDSSAWLMVYDHRLQFKWEPVQFKGLWKYISVFPYHNNLFVRVTSIGQNGGAPRILKVDNNGNSKSEIYLFNEKDIQIGDFFTINDFPDRIFLSGGGDRVYEFDEDLNITSEYQVNEKHQYIYVKDLDLDGKQEILTNTKDGNKTIILSNDFGNPVFIDIEGSLLNNINIRLNGTKPPQFIIRTGNVGKHYLLSYFENPMYVFQYPIWLGIYLLITGFVFMVQRFQDMQHASRRKIEMEMARLQLANVKNQFDPHFTFNALNTIGSVIYKEDKKVAYDYFVKFTKLIRVVLEGSEKLTTRLSMELEFIENYLDLQKLRFKDQFNYKIKISPDVQVDQVDVPRMIIQNYVENAVKHGLKPIKHGGLLLVQISRKGAVLHIVIEDNGVGRTVAACNTQDSTGKGIHLTNRFFELYELLYKQKISVEILDLEHPDGTPRGTRVELEIPLN